MFSGFGLVESATFFLQSDAAAFSSLDFEAVRHHNQKPMAVELTLGFWEV